MAQVPIDGIQLQGEPANVSASLAGQATQIEPGEKTSGSLSTLIAFGSKLNLHYVKASQGGTGTQMEPGEKKDGFTITSSWHPAPIWTCTFHAGDCTCHQKGTAHSQCYAESPALSRRCENKIMVRNHPV